jgi:hypothetical protein
MLTNAGFPYGSAYRHDPMPISVPISAADRADLNRIGLKSCRYAYPYGKPAPKIDISARNRHDIGTIDTLSFPIGFHIGKERLSIGTISARNADMAIPLSGGGPVAGTAPWTIDVFHHVVGGVPPSCPAASRGPGSASDFREVLPSPTSLSASRTQLSRLCRGP